MDVSLVAILVVAAALAAGLSSRHWIRGASGEGSFVRVLLLIETFVSIFIMTAMFLAALLQVVVRHYFSTLFDFSWTEELSRLLLVWMTYWAAATVQRNRDHIQVSVFYDLLPASGKTLLRAIVNVVLLCVLGIITKEGFQSAWHQMGQMTITLDLPVAIFAVAVPVGCAMMFIYTARNAIRGLAGQQARGP